MIELAAGGQAETKAGSAGGLKIGDWRTVAGPGVLALAMGLMTLPAAIGLLALVGAIR